MARRSRIIARETRLGALGARVADAEAVVADFVGDDLPQKRIRTFSEAAHDDLSAALDLLGLVEDLGLVVHGPRGCAVGSDAARNRIAVTDLDQRDTVLGAGDALAHALERLDETVHPAALVVLGSPVVAINNDEIRAVVAEVAEKIGKPVVWARTDGFRSHIAATGSDAAAAALLDIIGPQDGAREPDLVNLLTSWTGPAIDAFAAALATLGLRANVLPAGARVADLHRAARASVSVVLDPDGLDALAAGLAERFGAPVLDAEPPIGAKATATLLARLARLTGRDGQVEASAAMIENLNGRRIVLAAPSVFAFALADLAEGAGAEVVGLALPHLDRTHAKKLAAFSKRRPRAQIHVGEAQGFELANVLQRLNPDLVVGAVDAVAAALRLGVPAARLDPVEAIGAAGDQTFARAVEDAFAGAALARRLAKSSARYSAGWLRRSPDWHVKLEVK